MGVRARRIIILAASLVFIAAIIQRFHWLGGPYLDLFPETIQDHVWPSRFASADAIVACRKAAPLLPRGAEVTVIAPQEAPNYDPTLWLTGLGLLTRQRVVPPKFEGTTAETLPDYIVAVGPQQFPHQSYRQIAAFPEGRLYEVKR